MTKLPKTVQAAIDAYKETEGRTRSLTDTHRQRADELAVEIQKVQAQLIAATDATLDDPTPENLDKEAKLQRKLTELKLDKSAAEDRARRTSGRTSQRLAELADAAINAGREEAVRHYDANYDEKLKAVEDAKYAYLMALRDLHTLRTEAYEIYHTAVQETNSNRAEHLPKPYFTEPAINWRGGDRQVWGTSERETNRALKYGQILRTSVAPGREIE